MKPSVFVFDPTISDNQSRVRGVGRYLQLLKENFPDWIFTSNLAIKKFSNEVIFINPFFNFLQPPLLMKRVAKKQIAVIHDLIPLKYSEHFPAGIKGGINIYLNKLALKNYDLIVTDSQASRKDIVEILKVEESRVEVIYPCLPKLFTNYKLQMTNDKSISNSKFQISNSFCLYVGDATWNKNLVNIAKAIKKINIPCVFVGKVFDIQHQKSKIKDQNDKVKIKNNNVTIKQFNNKEHPWNKELYRFIKETAYDKRFIFLGFIDNYKLVKLYQQAKANILVSHDEGFGFSYLEAGNFGCPSVLSNISVLHEVSNNKGSVFVDQNNPDDIANKIKSVYFNSDLRNKLSFEAQQRAKSFLKNKFISSWENIFL